jgi:hypothetical protein
MQLYKNAVTPVTLSVTAQFAKFFILKTLSKPPIKNIRCVLLHSMDKPFECFVEAPYTC